MHPATCSGCCKAVRVKHGDTWVTGGLRVLHGFTYHGLCLVLGRVHLKQYGTVPKLAVLGVFLDAVNMHHRRLTTPSRPGVAAPDVKHTKSNYSPLPDGEGRCVHVPARIHHCPCSALCCAWHGATGANRDPKSNAHQRATPTRVATSVQHFARARNVT